MADHVRYCVQFKIDKAGGTMPWQEYPTKFTTLYQAIELRDLAVSRLMGNPNTPVPEIFKEGYAVIREMVEVVMKANKNELRARIVKKTLTVEVVEEEEVMAVHGG